MDHEGFLYFHDRLGTPSGTAGPSGLDERIWEWGGPAWGRGQGLFSPGRGAGPKGQEGGGPAYPGAGLMDPEGWGLLEEAGPLLAGAGLMTRGGAYKFQRGRRAWGGGGAYSFLGAGLIARRRGLSFPGWAACSYSGRPLRRPRGAQEALGQG